jgi:hypothetical protein
MATKPSLVGNSALSDIYQAYCQFENQRLDHCLAQIPDQRLSAVYRSQQRLLSESELRCSLQAQPGEVIAALIRRWKAGYAVHLQSEVRKHERRWESIKEWGIPDEMREILCATPPESFE